MQAGFILSRVDYVFHKSFQVAVHTVLVDFFFQSSGTFDLLPSGLGTTLDLIS